MNILLIGSPVDVDFVENSIEKHKCNIKKLLYTDTNGFDELLEMDLSLYDGIIVAFNNSDLCLNVIKIIKENLKCDKTILDFYSLYNASTPYMCVDKVMNNPIFSDFDGMILGISLSEVGILPQRMNGYFCNLAVSSQDLYYNLKTFEYCIEKYYNKIKNLKYLVIDMFNYTYFNYDTSLSKTAVEYLFINGGYNLDKHNFDKNKTFNVTFENLKNVFLNKRLKNINDESIDLWNILFCNVHKNNSYENFIPFKNIDQRIKIVDPKDVNSYNINSSIVKNVFEETLTENINIFYKLLETAYIFNPEIKIYAVLLPKYYEYLKNAEPYYENWKKFFNNEIAVAQKKYPFEFFDFTNHEISKTREYFYDVMHLNYYGAEMFTNILNEYIGI